MRVKALENVIYGSKIYEKGEEFEIPEKSGLLNEPRKVEVVDKAGSLPAMEKRKK